MSKLTDGVGRLAVEWVRAHNLRRKAERDDAFGYTGPAAAEAAEAEADEAFATMWGTMIGALPLEEAPGEPDAGYEAIGEALAHYRSLGGDPSATSPKGQSVELAWSQFMDLVGAYDGE